MDSTSSKGFSRPLRDHGVTVGIVEVRSLLAENRKRDAVPASSTVSTTPRQFLLSFDFSQAQCGKGITQTEGRTPKLLVGHQVSDFASATGHSRSRPLNFPQDFVCKNTPSCVDKKQMPSFSSLGRGDFARLKSGWRSWGAGRVSSYYRASRKSAWPAPGGTSLIRMHGDIPGRSNTNKESRNDDWIQARAAD